MAIENNQVVYRGIVKTGIGGAVTEMSKPGSIEEFQLLTGLSIIPGTLNISLTEPLDLGMLKYLRFADIGWEFDPATQGIKFDGEIGMYFRRVVVANNYPAYVILFTWAMYLGNHAELISPYHLRSTLGLQDGDVVEFVLAD